MYPTDLPVLPDEAFTDLCINHDVYGYATAKTDPHIWKVLQKKQGFNLEDYKGANAKMWTYNLNNFPGLENKKDYVQANIIIYNGNVIGADITVRGETPETYILEFPKDVKNDTET